MTVGFRFGLRAGVGFGVVVVGAGVVATVSFAVVAGAVVVSVVVLGVITLRRGGFVARRLGATMIVGSVTGATISSLVVTTTSASVVCAAAAGSGSPSRESATPRAVPPPLRAMTAATAAMDRFVRPTSSLPRGRSQ